METPIKTLTLLIMLFTSLAAASIDNYRPIDYCFRDKNATFKAIREFRLDKQAMLLILNPYTLKTKITKSSNQEAIPCPADSPYHKLLKRAALAPFPLQNDGITHAKGGLYLTTDLCPSSKKGFEKRLYEAIIKRLRNPVSLNIFITKRWIEAHEAAFKWLKKQDQSGKLSIIWGNHTAWHHYRPGAPLKQNFVLMPEENLSQDILSLEKSLLEYGVTPSIFFRFPGLISNKRAIKTVSRLGLITIGADAWLAKGQLPKQGSIILVHGNRNEPRGVDIFLKLLQSGVIKELKPLTDIRP